jgi:hypothetical protein
VALLNQRSKHGNGCIRGARETPSCLYPYIDLSEPPGEVLWDKGQGITGFDSGTPKDSRCHGIARQFSRSHHRRMVQCRNQCFQYRERTGGATDVGGFSPRVWVGSRKDELPSGAASPGGLPVVSRASSYLISLSTVSIQARRCRAGLGRTG